MQPLILSVIDAVAEGQPPEVSRNHRIEICTSNPEQLRSDYLYKLLPNILNPGGMHV